MGAAVGRAPLGARPDCRAENDVDKLCAPPSTYSETDRKIRDVFQRAKEKAADDVPIVISFDEMDALFRTRGSGISSNVEHTVAPQFLTEVDGVESLRNVVAIGASNRPDLIDPAIL